ncbi:MAG: hypothetical protein AAGC60_08345 [Acidobacteriota bacterium]
MRLHVPVPRQGAPSRASSRQRSNPCAPTAPRAIVAAVAAAVALSFLLATPSFAAEDEQPEATRTATVDRLAQSGEWVEIQVTSDDEPFPVRALPPVLTIGDTTFTRSLNPADGRLETLIFLAPAKSFAALETGASMRVFYALSTDADARGVARRAVAAGDADVWDLGAFDASRLTVDESTDHDSTVHDAADGGSTRR